MVNDNGASAHQQPKPLLEWLNLIVTEPFYAFHLLAFFSYVVFRSSTSQFLSPYFAHHLLHREIQAVLAFSFLVAIKLVKEDTWEAFIGDLLFYAKLFLIAISSLLDYHLALLYVLLFSVIYVVSQQPAFQGLGASNKLTPLQLEALLTEGHSSRFWLVEFRALSSPDCVRVSRCLPELSITYSKKNLSFGIVDLGLFPNAAEKFGISLSGSLSQVPSYILFENAAEVTRFPEVKFEEKPYHPSPTKRLLARHFELDRHLLAYVNGK